MIKLSSENGHCETSTADSKIVECGYWNNKKKWGTYYKKTNANTLITNKPSHFLGNFSIHTKGHSIWPEIYLLLLINLPQ